jgi:predicted glycoside hydrolase/deacetylase ChbG (UPF0249 family)
VYCTKICILVLFFFVAFPKYLLSKNTVETKTYLVIRCDDMGMNHSVNIAAERLFESGIPVSVSVMFTCPWYQEAVEILKKYPDISVGVHTTLNAEWKNYRWGPILGKEAVPGLVDSLGFFFPSRAKLFANNPTKNEIEKELRAQIERALNSGIKIDYIDHHMSAAVETMELREMFEGLASEYNLGISTYFGENYSSITYGAELQNKTDSLIIHLDKLKPGFNLQVLHIGLNTSEMRALKDMNEFGLPNMSLHRQAELNSLLSPEFKVAIQKNNINLITYRDIIRLIGLENMTRPEIN